MEQNRLDRSLTMIHLKSRPEITSNGIKMEEWASQ